MIAALGVLAVVAAAAFGRAWSAAERRRLVRNRLAPITEGGARVAPASGRRAVLAVAAGAGALFVLGPLVAVLAAAGVALAPAAVARWRLMTAASGDADALADVVDALARALRAGTPPRSALRVAAGTAPTGVATGLVGVASAADRGVPLVSALDQWASSSAVDGAGLLAAAVAVTSSSGGDPARALTAVADTLRDRRSLRREVRALSSQARMSALVIAVAPLGFALAAAGTDGATADFLLRSPLGFACMALGLVLDVAGWWWMDRITRTLR